MIVYLVSQQTNKVRCVYYFLCAVLLNCIWLHSVYKEPIAKSAISLLIEQIHEQSTRRRYIRHDAQKIVGIISLCFQIAMHVAWIARR